MSLEYMLTPVELTMTSFALPSKVASVIHALYVVGQTKIRGDRFEDYGWG